MKNESPTIPEMLTTEQAAAALHKKPQSLRVWSCHGSGPIQPVRLGKRGPLLWRKSDIIAILSGEVDVLENAGLVKHENAHNKTQLNGRKNEANEII